MLINKSTIRIIDRPRLAIYLNFSEGDHHGCSKNCSFCAFKPHPQYMCSSVQDVKDFILQYKTDRLYTILLSGGGDPLYKFEENKDKIIPILNVIKECGIRPVMQSYELDTIDKYWNTIFKDIKDYYFSVEGFDEKLIKLADKLLANNRKVHLSKITNFSKNFDDIDFFALDKWIDYYKDHCSALHLKENYTCIMSRDDDAKIDDYFRSKYRDSGYVVMYHQHRKACHLHLALINNEIWAPFEYFHKVLLNNWDEVKNEQDCDSGECGCR